MSDVGLSLHELIRQVRKELIAIQNDPEIRQNPVMDLNSLDLELEVEVSGDAQVGLKFLIVDLQSGVSGKRTHRIKLSFSPYNKQSEPQSAISSDGDVLTYTSKGEKKLHFTFPDALHKYDPGKKGRLRFLPFPEPIPTIVLDEGPGPLPDLSKMLEELNITTKQDWGIMLAPKIASLPLPKGFVPPP